MKKFLAAMTVATFFAACSEKPSASVAVQEPVAPQPEFADTTAVDSSLFAAPDSAALAQDSIRIAREAFVADSTAAAEARAVPGMAYAIEDVYAIRTGANEFSLFRSFDPETPFYVVKDATRTLNGLTYTSDVDFAKLYGKEEGEAPGQLKAHVNMVNGTVSIGYLGNGPLEVFQLTDEKRKDHVIDSVKMVCRRTGDREFQIVDLAFPNAPLYTIAKAEPTDLAQTAFMGIVPFKELTGREPQGEDDDAYQLRYNINAKSGQASVSLGGQTVELKVVNAPTVKVKAAPVVAKQDTLKQ